MRDSDGRRIVELPPKEVFLSLSTSLIFVDYEDVGRCGEPGILAARTKDLRLVV